MQYSCMFQVTFTVLAAVISYMFRRRRACNRRSQIFVFDVRQICRFRAPIVANNTPYAAAHYVAFPYTVLSVSSYTTYPYVAKTLAFLNTYYPWTAAFTLDHPRLYSERSTKTLQVIDCAAPSRNTSQRNNFIKIKNCLTPIGMNLKLL